VRVRHQYQSCGRPTISLPYTFLFAFVFITSENLKILPVGLQLLVCGDIYPWGQLMGASLLMVIPVVVISMYAQKYMVEGLTAGSVKG